MRPLHIFLAFLAVAAFGVWQYMANLSLEAHVAILQKQLAAARVKPAIPTPTPEPTVSPRIVCPACDGEKVIVYDPTETDNPLKRKAKDCPVCLGNGYRMLTIPSGMKRCPDCQGMGLVYFRGRPGESFRAGNCVRCAARGYVPSIK
jgi:hypothetical protein